MERLNSILSIVFAIVVGVLFAQLNIALSTEEQVVLETTTEAVSNSLALAENDLTSETAFISRRLEIEEFEPPELPEVDLTEGSVIEMFQPPVLEAPEDSIFETLQSPVLEAPEDSIFEYFPPSAEEEIFEEPEYEPEPEEEVVEYYYVEEQPQEEAVEYYTEEPKVSPEETVEYYYEEPEMTVGLDQAGYLAGLIQTEAGAVENFNGRIGVGLTVLSRMNSDAYPDDMRAVVEQPHQYATPKKHYTDENLAAAQEAINLWNEGQNETIIPEEVMYFFGYNRENWFYKINDNGEYEIIALPGQTIKPDVLEAFKRIVSKKGAVCADVTY